MRDALLLTGASYLRFVSLGHPRSLLGLVFPQEAVIEMKPINSSKVCRFNNARLPTSLVEHRCSNNGGIFQSDGPRSWFAR